MHIKNFKNIAITKQCIWAVVLQLYYIGDNENKIFWKPVILDTQKSKDESKLDDSDDSDEDDIEDKVSFLVQIIHNHWLWLTQTYR